MTDWYGPEGYCRRCRFIQPLDDEGLLLRHGQPTRQCEGSGRLPAKRIPVTSRKSAFKTIPPKGKCRACFTEQPMTTANVMARHFSQHLVCAGTGYPPLPPPPTPVILRRDRG